MGGRGSSLKAGSVTPATRFQATGVKEMRNQLSNEFGMSVSTMHDDHIEMIYESLKDFESVDPMLLDVLAAAQIDFSLPIIGQDTHATANGWSAEIKLNATYFDKPNDPSLKASLDRNLASGFHNSSEIRSVVAHELSHFMHYGIVASATHLKQQGVKDKIVDRFSGDKANGQKVANNLVNAAARKSKAQIDFFRRSISGYAGTNNREATAEAFTDVLMNKGKARAQSRAVVNEYLQTYHHLNNLVVNNP
jgi:hypothetical protein